MEMLNNILLSCVDGKKKAQVVYSRDLSRQQLCAYLELLTSRGLLTVKSVGNEKLYVTTEKGLSLLKYFKEVNSLLQYIKAVIDVLENADGCVTIREIQEQAGIRNWSTVRKIVTSLLNKDIVAIHHKDEKSACYLLK